MKEEHINSSNLLHLEAILHICEHAPSVVAVQQGFCYLPEGTGSLSQSVLVDVIAHEGGTWVRVFARNRKAIHQKLLGQWNIKVLHTRDPLQVVDNVNSSSRNQ